MSGSTTPMADLEGMQAWARELMASRPRDFQIGDDYIRRWWVIPRNRLSNQYLHLMTGDDDDRALHDHPWANTSVILEGGFIEITPEGSFERRPGDVIHRLATDAHRLVLRRDEAGNKIPSISLFATGPNEREWGFHCPKGWVHWKEFTDYNESDGSSSHTGKGCGEMA